MGIGCEILWCKYIQIRPSVEKLECKLGIWIWLKVFGKEMYSSYVFHLFVP